MKRILVPLLALALLCACAAAFAEGEEAVTLELNTRQLPVYAADDPALAGLLSEDGDSQLPVLVVPVKERYDLQVTILPEKVRNKRYELAVDNPETVVVIGHSVTGKKAGETVLTISSVEDPTAVLRYRVLVTQPVTRISVTPSAKKVAVGETVTLTAEILPENATIKNVTWISEDESIATVDENGVVTALKKGTARFKVKAEDGSKTRASVSVQVVQKAEQIELDKAEVTVDAGRSAVLKATVLPKNTDDKNVVWTSTDENIAKVNAQGRVTGVALGDCEIVCTDKLTGTIEARATVHVQQPVTKIAFNGDQVIIYAGDTQQLSWTVQPADASNPKLQFTSGKQSIVTVNEDGTVTGVASGETVIRAVTTDGSNRQAKIKVKVLQHVTGVHMLRRVAYIDVKQTSNTRAVLEPEKATDNRMTWESADPSIATVQGDAKTPNRVKITGVSRGETVVTGTTVDGGYQASILVKIGDWERSLKITEAHVDGDAAVVTVKNTSDLTITSVTVEVTIYDNEGKPVPCNSKDDSCTFKMVYKKTLEPGASTKQKYWKVVDYRMPDSLTVSEYEIRVTEFVIDNDWVKLIRQKYQPTKKCPVHI